MATATRPAPRRTDPEARRRELLDAAVRAIREHGPDASMADLAAAAGVSKPVLYASFRDKSELAAALADRYLGELATTLPDAGDAVDQPPRTTIRRTIGAFVAFAEKEPALYRFLVEGSAGTGRQAVELPMLTALAERIAAFLRGPSGMDRHERADAWAFAIMGMVFSAVGWWLDTGARTRRQLVEDLTDLVFGGLAGGGVDAGA